MTSSEGKELELHAQQHLDESPNGDSCDAQKIVEDAGAGMRSTDLDQGEENGRIEDEDEETALLQLAENNGSIAFFVIQCRLALQLGLAAYQYGSFAMTVERFIENLLYDIAQQPSSRYYYPAKDENDNIHENNENGEGAQRLLNFPVDSVSCRISNSEIFLCVLPALGDDYSTTSNMNIMPISIMTELQEGYHLDKLSRVAALVAEVLEHVRTMGESGTSLEYAVRIRLPKIKDTPDPYGVLLMGSCWIMVGFGLPPVLGGTWWDAIVGAAVSGITYAISIGFSTCVPARYQNPWSNFFSAFTAACITTGIKISIPSANINVILTTLSAVAIPLPGYR